jgi:adenylate kinase family enzyme
LDGEKLMIRPDDSEPVIRQRLAAYEFATRPVLEYYRNSGRQVIEVDVGCDPPQRVFERICRDMEKNDCSKDRR